MLSHPLHRLCWSTLPIAQRSSRPALLSACPFASRHWPALHTPTRSLSASTPAAAAAARRRAAATTSSAGQSYAAVWLSLLAGSAWLASSTVSADAAAPPPPAPPRAVNSRTALARQVNRAAAMGDVAALRRLLKDNPAPDTANLPHPSGWTPLLAAAANGHDEAVAVLLEHGADVNGKDKYAVTRRNLSTDLLRSRAEFQTAINPRISCLGWTPLHYGTHRQQTHCGQSRTTHSASQSVARSFTHSLAYAACSVCIVVCAVAVAFQHLSTIELLLSHGADIAAKNAEGDEPLGCIDWEYVDNGQEVRQRLESVFSSERERRLVEQRRREKEERVRNPLEVKLRQSMVGQLMPIYSVSSAIRRRENGWYDASKPLVFLFLGSSGVGKTMLAKTLAKELHPNDQDNRFIRIGRLTAHNLDKHGTSRYVPLPAAHVSVAALCVQT